MTDILAQNLTEKGVMRNDGKEMGTLENITVDLKTGKLESIVVKPKTDIVKSDFQSYDKDSEGNFLVPVRWVESITDHIMVRDGDVIDTGAVGPADRKESSAIEKR
jgi:sporulation protein YlmC with PRC-barrel domain